MLKYYQVEPQLIDMEKVVRNQKNMIIKKMPKFAVNYLKKIVKQDELNEIILNSYTETGYNFFRKNLDFMNIKIESENFESIEEKGKYIFAANHVQGGIDGIALVLQTSEKFKNIKALANEILMTIKNAEEIFLPVNVFSRNSEETKRKLDEAYSSNDIQIITFPSGEVARKYKGVIDDGLWHQNFIRNALKYERDIVPVYIVAENSSKFYRVSNIRRRLRIKANIELFLLPQELLKQKGKTLKLIFGKPVSYKTFDQTKTHLEWAQEIKKVVYSLYKKKEN
jgi:putative hemolysin